MVEKLAIGGSGIGRVDGKVCFIPFSIPGERVRARVLAEKRSHMFAEPLDILEPSPLRVHPPCPVFGSCGGCSWQHIQYDFQLKAKQELFSETLLRAGGNRNAQIDPIVPSLHPFEYRSRVQLKVRFVNGSLHLGFYRHGSHFVVDVPSRCAISVPGINSLIPVLTEVLSTVSDPDRIPQVDISCSDDGAAVVIVHYLGQDWGNLASILKEDKRLQQVGIFLQTGRKSTLMHISGCDLLSYAVRFPETEREADLKLSFLPASFSQVNYRQNSALIETVAEWAALTGTETVLDLFCGNGNISLPLARRAGRILGLENYEPSIQSARRNCLVNNIHNCRFEVDDATAGAAKLAAAGERFDVIILDPPRTGAAELMGTLPGLSAKKVIYVSCDPATLARDAGLLSRAGYLLRRSRALDMFPQTWHIESVTLFTKE